MLYRMDSGYDGDSDGHYARQYSLPWIYHIAFLSVLYSSSRGIRHRQCHECKVPKHRSEVVAVLVVDER